jgi:hypothetical protein
MLTSAILGTLWFEAGTWFGMFVSKFGSRERNQNILTQGYQARTAIPIADNYIEKQSLHASKMQRSAARRLTAMIRAFVNTRAFEFVLLQKIHESWPGKKQHTKPVRLIV